MKKILLLLLINSQLLTANSQLNYWQQQVNYVIDVSLNDKEHTLDGFEKIEYINNSPDTLTFIWFHLWPNAFKNDRTAFTDQTLENGSTKFYFSDKEQKGYINRLDFKVNNTTSVVEDHPNHIDIIKLVLPAPLPPGQKITITTPFHVKLPFNFSRGGHNGESYQVTQWFPKPAVYDKNGWHPMPYLDQGEYYSDFGDYKVTITVPKNYVVAATGELQEAEEKKWLKEKVEESVRFEERLYKTFPHNADWRKKSMEFPPSWPETKTISYIQNNVHDFAWFADKRYLVKQDTMLLGSGKIIEAYAYYTRPEYKVWQTAIQSTKNAIAHYSGLVGEYPYNTVSVVQAPLGFTGGMEYPTITAIAPISDIRSLDNIIVHEVGHNWFYGILASNEREHPWMDEGMNSYYDSKYDRMQYGKHPQLERLAFETKAVTKTDQPIETPSEKFTEVNYHLTSYYKTAEWLRYLESQLGTETFNTAMQEYYRRWKFKHPQPEDFKKVMEEVSGKDLDTEFALLHTKGTLPNQQRNGSQISFLFDFKALMDYAKQPTKNLVLYGPAIGVNAYDKFMIGGFLTNAKLPPSKFQFFIMPLYGTGSKKFGGIGFASYSHYSEGLFRAIDIGVAGSKFTIDEFTGTSNKKTFLGFHKIVPGIKLSFKNKDPRSNFNRFIQFKSFLIREEGLSFYRDTVIAGIDTTITTKHRTVNSNRTLNQLQFVIENNRVLYPYRGELKIEQGKDFVRAGFTGNYFFNYPKEGGLNVRVFAGKFFYTSTKTIFKQFATDRYHLNMTGPNGYEDYTYSDYFIGRNKFEGFTSQQIMIRDGAFKVRTDLLADKVGKTDDWLIAANFNTTIPAAINPLTMLPIKIPLKIFLDIGTHAEAWDQKEENDRFLFDAGLQISLLKETLNIYFPIIYSNVYKQYIQSTIEKKDRFIKKISFSINMSGFNFRKIDRNLSF